MSNERLRVALAQLDFHVGAIDANAARIVEAMERARDGLRCQLVLFPELALCGYPPEDLLLHAGMQRRTDAALARVAEAARGITAVVGYPEYQAGAIHNACAVLADGRVVEVYRKQVLPNYSVFDEKRYFTPGVSPLVVTVGGARVGLHVCEDIWEPDPCTASQAAGAQVLLAINGSPYSADSQARREKVVRDRVRETGRPLLYVNTVGGQDELVFDGGSAAVARNGELAFRAPAFEEGLHVVELRRDHAGWDVVPGEVVPPLPLVDSVYRALVTGTRDYVVKHGFPGVVIGLSGGIDSALTAAIAMDALGAERVRCVMMPSRYTSQMSLDDARAQAETMGVRYDELSIEPLFNTALDTLAPMFEGREPDSTEENIQSRCRGLLLMAVSNKTGCIVLTTGNKSEMAVGYATLYGDMAGGFAPIKDCSKTLVYRLAHHRNAMGRVIPERVITREPSAELRPEQRDTDSLPPYDVLDPILEAFIEADRSVEDIAALGFDKDTVGRVLAMVRRNEYKRRQAPPGVRVSRRAFGRDWRYPITSGY